MLVSSKIQLHARIIGRAELPSIALAWQELCDRAVEPNICFSPHYALPLLKHVEPATRVETITLWHGEKLVGLFPVTHGLGLPGMSLAGKAWQTLYSFTATPLFDRDHVNACAERLVRELAALTRGEWMIQTIREDGPVALAISAALDAHGAPHRFINKFERASLVVKDDFDTHMLQHLSTSLRKNLAKRRRKFESTSKLEYRHYRTAAELDEAVQAFLHLESQGWKGKRGTALANHPGSKAFAIDAFGAKAEGRAFADMLLADGKPVAVILTALSGTTGFTVKNTYDENFAEVSPGLLLEVEFLKNQLGSKSIEQFDAGTAGKHVIDGFWPGRMPMADMVFSFAHLFAEKRLDLLEKRNTALVAIKPKLKKLLGRE
jgi:CelD/BcsL family acetyltransferase involved in cellulose biosynthesis